MGKSTKYWKGLGELTNNPEVEKLKQDEFAEQLPSDVFTNDALNESDTSRRDFLKYLGFSVGVAALASCEAPVTKTIPYVIKPEEITPGVANWYASTFDNGSDYCSILVKTREGRPIKLEGNSLSKVTLGGINARVEASVLSLYDQARIRTPLIKGAEASKVQLDKAVKSELDKAVASGKSIRILSASIISPSTNQALADFSAKYPNTKHISYDAVSYAAIRKANQNTFGKAEIPSYNFANANVIVSFDADFLVNWLSPIEYSRQYSKNRKVSKAKKSMSKHVQFESLLSITGSNADVRVPIKPSEIGAAVVALYNALAGTSLPVSGKVAEKQIAQTAKLLKENQGKALVISGVNDVAVQVVVNEINKLIGSYGATIDLETPNYTRQGNDEEFAALLTEMKEGKVGALIVYRSNPVYTAAGLGFAEAFNKVPVKISLSESADETSALCDFVFPDNHYLESWSDANPKKGHYSLGQPAIAPLFETRAAQESLLIWAGNATAEAHSYIQKYWETNLFSKQTQDPDFVTFWNNSLQNGVAELANTVSTSSSDKTTKVTPAAKGKSSKEEAHQIATVLTAVGVNVAAETLAKASKPGNYELIIYEKAGLGSGKYSNNPWLTEFPDPISKVSWDNYVTLSPIDMKGKYALLERQNMVADIAEVTVGNVKVKLPVFPQPGQAPGTLGISIGHGRGNSGKVAEIAGGVNAYQFLQLSNGALQYVLPNASIGAATGEHFEFACTQMHHTMMGRDIVKETDLITYSTKPVEEWNERELISVFNKDGEHVKVEAEKSTLWDEHERLGPKWSMAIDLNSCIGCGTCVIACQAENNVPVVGRDQVRKTRDMYWMRIDRYYSSDMTEERAEEGKVGKIEMYLEMENPQMANPRVVFQPVMCQHCDHAPCETVCPVLATNHSSEGLNQMTYNRCVGTRYCANNCPYKVRRFNWFNYLENYRFEHINPAREDLGRMVLNPDVVVRSRGVMEKCTLCVQRIQAGKLTAKKENRKLKDGDIQTACAKSCPTNAIIFGNINDPESEVSAYYQDERSYHLLESVGARPSVFYMTKVRNTESEEAKA